MLELYPYNVQILDGYLFVFYEPGGGEVVLITTPAGEYITGDLVSEEMDDQVFDLLSG